MSFEIVGSKIGVPPIKSQGPGNIGSALSGAIKTGEDIQIFNGLSKNERDFANFQFKSTIEDLMKFSKEMRANGIPEDQILANLKAIFS